MNPSFSHFDLDPSAIEVLRRDEFNVKVWAKNSNSNDYLLLLDLHVNLRSLQYLGQTLDNFHHPLPQNCVLFHLEDGIYTSFTDLPAEDIVEPHLRPSQRGVPPTNVSSYDALMKLANLDECIQDALQVREKLEADINALLAKSRDSSSSSQYVGAQRERTQQAKTALNEQRAENDRLRERREELQRQRSRRQQAMSQAGQTYKDALELPGTYQTQIEALHEQIRGSTDLASGQVRRVCEDLLRIYPIEPIKNRSLQFTIRSIHLPNSVFDDTNRDQIAAALGYTGHLVHHLALYLSMPLPYPIEPNGSSTFIKDPISVSLAQREFPLHPTNVNYKFEYGVFLLNKDVEFLSNRSGLRVVDIRHTLPNLKYLLYILTAGTSELPARKAGGIRGLWGGPLSPTISRRGSDDSVLSRGSVEVTNSAVLHNGKEKGHEVYDGFTGVGRAKALPYRHSLLREVE